jgi:hypothetical protein
MMSIFFAANGYGTMWVALGGIRSRQRWIGCGWIECNLSSKTSSAVCCFSKVGYRAPIIGIRTSGLGRHMPTTRQISITRSRRRNRVVVAGSPPQM